MYFVGKNWQKGYTSTRCIRTRFGNYFRYFHNNVPSQFHVPSWTHPSNHVKFYNNNMVRLPYNVNPFGTARARLDWHSVMRMEYPLATHMWKLSRVISNQPCGSFVNTDMIMDRQYGLSQPNITLLDKNKYCVNALQRMATKCEMDKKGVLLFPIMLHHFRSGKHAITFQTITGSSHQPMPIFTIILVYV